MDLYGKKSKSIPQKLFIIVGQIALLLLAYHILFNDLGSIIYQWLGLKAPTGNFYRNWIIFVFSLIIFLRLSFMMLFLLKRKIPLEEAFSVLLAFSLYYVGFALLVLDTSIALDGWDVIGVFLFLSGSFINTASELQRNFWKQKPENKGKLFTQGFFRYSMHINYFGDLLWVTGAAVVTRNLWAATIPFFIFCFFAFYNIPKLDAYLAGKYKEQFQVYKNNTKRFIPFIY